MNVIALLPKSGSETRTTTWQDAESFLGAQIPGALPAEGSIELLNQPEMEDLMLERRPFFIIDRAVVMRDADGKCVDVYGAVHFTEEMVAGHFPGRPIVPLIYLCKAMAQTGIILTAEHGQRSQAPIAIKEGGSEATTKSLVDAPARIITKVTRIKGRGPVHFVDGSAFLVNADRSVSEIGKLNNIVYTLIERALLLKKPH